MSAKPWFLTVRGIARCCAGIKALAGGTRAKPGSGSKPGAGHSPGVAWRATWVVVLLGLCLGLGGGLVAAQDASAGADPPQCPKPPFDWPEYYVSPDFDHDHMILASGYDGASHLYRSTDGGRAWQMSQDEIIDVVGFSPNFAQDHTIYVVPQRYSDLSVLVRSTDGGATWQRVSMRGAQVGGYASTLAVADANTLFLGRFGGPPGLPGKGLFYSADGGATWEYRATGFNGVIDVELSPRYAEDDTLFVAAIDYKINYGLHKSTDNGHTWAPRNEGLYLSGGAYTTSIVFSPGYPADPTILCQSTSVFFRSTNAGAAWQAVFPPDCEQHPEHCPTAGSPARWVLSPYFVTDRTAWITDWFDNVARLTTDAGDTWTVLGPQASDLAARESCTAAGRCGVLLLKNSFSILKSYDLGRTWHCPQEDVTPPWAAPPAEIPEPTTWLLLGSGLAALAGWAQRRR